MHRPRYLAVPFQLRFIADVHKDDLILSIGAQFYGILVLFSAVQPQPQPFKPYKISRTEVRELRRYRQFYQIYPQIRETVSPKLQAGLPLPFDSANIQKRTSTSMSGNDLASRLSFSHIIEILRCEDDTKRTFYDVECIRGNWSVRELRRQINSLYYERSGLSVNKAKLSDVTQATAEKNEGTLDIRDPYISDL